MYAALRSKDLTSNFWNYHLIEPKKKKMRKEPVQSYSCPYNVHCNTVISQLKESTLKLGPVAWCACLWEYTYLSSNITETNYHIS